LMLNMTSAGRVSNVACKHKYKIFIEIALLQADYLFNIYACYYLYRRQTFVLNFFHS
jgi:hypothetical protein